MKRIYLIATLTAALLIFMTGKPHAINAQQAVTPSAALAKMQTGTPTHGALPSNMGEWYLNGHVSFRLTGPQDRIIITSAADFGFSGSELLEKTGISDFSNTTGARFEANPGEMLEYGGETDCFVDGWDFPVFPEQEGEGFGDHWFWWVRLTNGQVIILAEGESRGREYRYRIWPKHPAVRLYRDARAKIPAQLETPVDSTGPFAWYYTVFTGQNERRRTKEPVVIALDMQSWSMGQCATFGFTLKTMGWGGANGLLVSSIVTKTVERPGDLQATANVPGLFDGLTGGYYTGKPCGECEPPPPGPCLDSAAYWEQYPEYYSGMVRVPGYNFGAYVDAYAHRQAVQSALAGHDSVDHRQQTVARLVAWQLNINRLYGGQSVPLSAFSSVVWQLVIDTVGALQNNALPGVFAALNPRWDSVLGTNPLPQCYILAPCPCPPGGNCGK